MQKLSLGIAPAPFYYTSKDIPRSEVQDYMNVTPGLCERELDPLLLGSS